MAGAVMNFIEDHEHTVVIEKPPEPVISVFHGLIGEGRPHCADLAVQTPAKHRSKGRAKALDNLAGWREAQHQIDPVLLKQSAGQLCRHARLAGTRRCLAEEVRRGNIVLQRRADAAELPVSQRCGHRKEASVLSVFSMARR
ncbi:hypothetical protein D3C84_885590 [compost metagenome]